MKTDELISALAADTARPRLAPGPALLLAVVLAVIAAGALFAGTIGVRHDFAAALATVWFDFKFAVTLTLAASAFVLVRRSLFPEASEKLPWALLLAAPLLLLAGVAIELLVLPPDVWVMSAVGKNALLCLTIIPALGILPLGLTVWALRQGAPTRPGRAGMLAGFLAGGIAATFYAANCTDDSPLFVLTWYPIAISLLALAGFVLARLFARW